MWKTVRLIMDSRTDLAEYLCQVKDWFPTQRTFEAIVFDNGREFAPPVTARPKGIKKGRDKQCFRNAYRLMDRCGYRYVEGFVMACGIPIHHAWVIDEKDNVIETTWAEVGQAYYGIEFDEKFINTVVLETRTYGVLDFTSKTFRKYAEAQ